MFNIATVLIRILAIKVFMDGIYGLINYPTLAVRHSPVDTFAFLFAAVVFMLIAAGLWYTAPFFAGIITRGNNSSVQMPHITAEDLHSFAFVAVGLFFIGSSFGQTLNWMYYSISKTANNGSSSVDIGYFYRTFRYVTELGIGLFFVLRNRRLAELTCKSSWDPKSKNASRDS